MRDPVAGPKELYIYCNQFSAGRWWQNKHETFCSWLVLAYPDEQTNTAQQPGPARQCHSTGNRTLALFQKPYHTLQSSCCLEFVKPCKTSSSIASAPKCTARPCSSFILADFTWQANNWTDGPSPGTRNPSHIWPNQCAACSQNGASWCRSVLVGKPWQPNLASFCPLEL